MRLRRADSFLGACALAVGAGAGASTAAAQTPDGPTDVCSLLTVDEAAKTLGGEVEVLAGSRVLNIHFNSFNTNMFTRKSFERRVVDAAKRAEKRL